jgi:sugar O-acyltransferase (sialic acid O-acetyltransferase NeuD family)
MTKEIILVGAGGHGKACVEVIESNKQYRIKGFIDAIGADKRTVLGYPILGDDQLIDEEAKLANVQFLVAVGQIKSAATRIKIFDHILRAGGKLATVVASTAVVARSAKLEEGTIVMHQVLVNADAHIGKNVILNNKCLVEHDCVIGDHVHISTGALINGSCSIGSRVFVGSGVVLKNDIHISNDVVIGAGSYVRQSILEKGIYSGNPAKKIGDIN